MIGFRNVGFTKPFTDNAGRLRVSQMTSLGDYKILNSDLQPLLMQYLGTGTVVNNVNRATLSVDGLGIQTQMIAQTKMYHPYLNGKSQLINMTVSNFQIQFANAVKKFGYVSRNPLPDYPIEEGFFIQGDNLVGYSFRVMRNGLTISNQNRTSWIDKLDGTGASGMNIDWAKFNIFAFDFLYLGGSCINCYVYYNGSFHLFNTYYHANTNTAPMFLSPNKALSWELQTGNSPATLDVICGEVAVEGINTDLGIGTAISSPIAGVNCVLAGTTYPLVGVRKKTTSRDIHAIIEGFEAQCSTTNDRIRLDVILNPNVLVAGGGSFTYSNLANSPLQVATPTGVVTASGGFVLDSSLITTNANVSKIIANPLRALCSTLDNTMDEIILCATPSLASTNVLATGYINAKWYT